MYIVMTSCAKMPRIVKSPYRNVAIVEVDQEYTARDLTPAMISERARGVLSVRHLGHHFVGRTDRCAYSRVVAEAEAICARANSAPDIATAERIARG